MLQICWSRWASAGSTWATRTIGVAQLLVTLVTCGIGALWPFIDGILILVNDTATDAQGRPLRPS